MPVNMICTSAQIPRITFYNWWSRYRLGGLEGLEPRSRQPHTVHRIPPENVERILRLRREKGWCPILIEGYLRRVESIEIGHTTIHRLLKQAGLNNPLPKPRQQRSYKTLAAEASEQPMAMRPQGRRRQMAHHNPRRSQPLRNRQPHIQRRHRRERDLSPRPGYSRVRETTRDPHRSWIAILERTQRRIKLRRILREKQDQAYPWRNR